MLALLSVALAAPLRGALPLPTSNILAAPFAPFGSPTLSCPPGTLFAPFSGPVDKAVCAICGTSRNGMPNCCSTGGSWAGKCTATGGDGSPTYMEGYTICLQAGDEGTAVDKTV